MRSPQRGLANPTECTGNSPKQLDTRSKTTGSREPAKTSFGKFYVRLTLSASIYLSFMGFSL